MIEIVGVIGSSRRLLELAREDELHRRREGHVLAGRDRAVLAADPRRRGVNVLEK